MTIAKSLKTVLLALGFLTFAASGAAAELAKPKGTIVLTKGDGAYLGVGGRGPIWIVYDVPDGKGSAEDEARWPWAVCYIAAE